jgi:hypothetical protein
LGFIFALDRLPSLVSRSSSVNRPIRVDVAVLDKAAFEQEKAHAPTGIEITGLKYERINETTPLITYFLLFLAVGSAEVAKHLAADLVKDWLKIFLIKINAKGVHINGKKPVDAADLDRLLSEEIEIGKND